MSLWIIPSLIPGIFLIVEGVNSLWVIIGPELAALTIWEVVIGSSNSDIENQIEFSIEWGIQIGLPSPWIVDAWVKATLGEHVLVEWEVKNFIVVDSCVWLCQ